MKNSEFRPLIREGPKITGMMSVVIESGGSLDSAVRTVAEDGPPSAKKFFSRIVADADIRVNPDIKTGLNGLISSLPKELAGFRRSMNMLMAASETAEGAEKTRILKDATDISLSSLKETGESYSSSLSNPCMIIFGLGIMVPMIMMSILPLMQIGGIFDSPFGTEPMIIVTLVIIPAAVLSVALSLKEKNPFFEKGDRDWKSAVPLALAFPLGILIWKTTEDFVTAAVFSSAIAGAAAFAFLYPAHTAEKKRLETEKLLKDSVFDLGNRMISGDNFENAVYGALNVRKETAGIAESFRRESVLCRGDVRSAIMLSVGTVSPQVAEIYCDVLAASGKDLRDAGRLAISMGRQIQDQETVTKGINNKLKSVLDMMTATAAVFAPLVLGLCISMLEPLRTISDSVYLGGTAIIVTVYLAELCAMMALLTSALAGKNGVRESVYRFSMMLPVSMIVFFLCMQFSF